MSKESEHIERMIHVKQKGEKIALVRKIEGNIQIEVASHDFVNKDDWYKAVDAINREINNLLLMKD